MPPKASQREGPGEENPQVRRVIPPEQFASLFSDWTRSIREALGPGAGWAVVGIKRRGAVLAGRLRAELSRTGIELPYGEVDISLYRDDYHLRPSHPRVLGTEIHFPVEGTRILLVDDVLFTGRTVTAALKLLLDFGRPETVWLAVFVDRGHRELPIAARFTAATIETDRKDHVLVRLREMGDSVDAVDVLPGGLKSEEGEA